MERKNMVLLTVIAVATLLVAVVGATFAYFTATVTDERTDNEANGQTQLNTAQVANTITTANIQNTAGKFSANDIYPGHMEVAALSVKVEGTNGKYSVPFLYDVKTNTIGSDVKYYLYSSDTDKEVDMGCTIVVDTTSEEGKTRYSETCDFKNTESVGTTATSDSNLTLVATGHLNASGEQKIEMLDDITVSNEDSATKYYYFVVEYHDNGDQTVGGQEGKTLDGNITILGATAKKA